ncbi:hypothetical protein T492DRAFT_894049 [Pavlovales sp. CCMP2436]|nr:hypothetical protein T492DRAFT_894049 [Pavlovales sp. CCMP2436]
MPLPFVAASAGRALFAFLYAAGNTPLSDAPSIYYRNASTQICTRLLFATQRMPALMNAYIEHSHDPMPACNDAAWTLAGLDRLDAVDRLVNMGLCSRSLIGPDGGVSLIFLDGDYSDGCAATRSTNMNLVVFDLVVGLADDAREADILELLHDTSWSGGVEELQMLEQLFLNEVDNALLLPAMLAIGIFLLVAWRRRSKKGNGKAVPVLNLLPLEVERSKVADWRLV